MQERILQHNNADTLAYQAINVLTQLIQIPSFSKEENERANWLFNYLEKCGCANINRHHNNMWVANKYFDPSKKTILLNSHIDTVKPNAGYTINPFEATINDGKLYGLGSNDAGGCLVSLLAVFLHFYPLLLPYNIIFLASAEEEISGAKGIASVIDKLPQIDIAIVGEPTNMQAATAEKGLMVIDAVTTGIAQHVALPIQSNAITNALNDIQFLYKIKFDKVSPLLGKVQCNVTQINSGTQHNVVPSICNFTIDVRTTDCYTNEEVFAILQSQLKSELTARSLRLQPSSINEQHPFVQLLQNENIECYGSATLSDQAIIPYDSIKMGPGCSTRSHSSDEFIFINEIEQAIPEYINLIEQYINK